MTKKIIEVDQQFIIKLAKSHDKLKQQVAHLEDHLHDDTSTLPPVPGLFVRATFQPRLVIPNPTVYMDQFKAEILSVLKQYNVSSFEGFYNQ